MLVWEVGPAQVMTVGSFGELQPHHHSAVQIGVGLDGPLTVQGSSDAVSCHVVVIASGTSHAVHTEPGAQALALYLAPHTASAVGLHSMSLQNSDDGIWVPPYDHELAASVIRAYRDSLTEAANVLLGRIPQDDAGLHPQLSQALQLIYSGATTSVAL